MRPGTIGTCVAALLVLSLAALLIASGRGRRHLGALTAALGFGAQSAAAIAQPVPPTVIGIHLTGLSWFRNDRPFANLILSGNWQYFVPTKRGWSDLEPQYIGKNGDLLALPPGATVTRMLTRPNTGPGGATIRCTYQGRGQITAYGLAKVVSSKPGELRFRWTNLWDGNNAWLQIAAMDPQAPISRLDCREVGLAPDVRFAPGYVDELRGFGVLRFMDWQRTNENAAVTWADRHDLTSLELGLPAGVAAEDIVAISNAAGAAPWVTVPWNADDDYIVRFARMLHDGIPADRQVYVELGNEVWNGMFPVSKQAGREGLERGLSRDGTEAKMLRYAQRTIEVMRLWEGVFADRPGRLVRVVSTQNVNPRTAEIVLGAPGLAQHVDALATAPYFGDLMREGPTKDLDEIFRRLGRRADEAIDLAVANRRVAARYGKRFLAYEAGQHVSIPDDLPLMEQVQRDPRMYDVYKRYLAGWRTRVGDVITLFAWISPIVRHGAFGLSEHVDQPLSEAPKLRAVLEERDR